MIMKVWKEGIPGDRPEAFLPSSIPDLETHGEIILAFENFRPEFDTDGGVAIMLEKSINKPGEDAGFADRGIANEDEFEEVVVVVHVGLCFFHGNVLVLHWKNKG